MLPRDALAISSPKGVDQESPDSHGRNSGPLPPATASLFPLEPLFELDRTPNRFRDDLAREPVCLKDGWLDIPDRPGLGLTVDETVIDRFLVDSAEIVISRESRNHSVGRPPMGDSSIPSE
jgi:hypothetical protein